MAAKNGSTPSERGDSVLLCGVTQDLVPLEAPSAA